MARASSMLAAVAAVLFLGAALCDAAAASPAEPPKDSYACPTAVCNAGFNAAVSAPLARARGFRRQNRSVSGPRVGRV